MHAYTHIYAYTHMCTTCSECVRKCVRWCKKHTCVAYTPAHALVPKTAVPKCMQHSLQKNAHMCIPTLICIRIHMYMNTHAHAWHRPHAEALILRPTIYAQICIHIHIHPCINAYIYMYIHSCTYIYIYMSAHIHTYTYIHTHIQIVYMYARKHVWNDGVAATAREARLNTKKLLPSPCPLQSGGGLPFVASSPIARPRETTDKRRITTINRSLSHHHDSAPSRPHPLICTVAGPIQPVHSPPKLPAWLWPPETKSFFCHFGWFSSIHGMSISLLRTVLLPSHKFVAHCAASFISIKRSPENPSLVAGIPMIFPVNS